MTAANKNVLYQDLITAKLKKAGTVFRMPAALHGTLSFTFAAHKRLCSRHR